MSIRAIDCFVDPLAMPFRLGIDKFIDVKVEHRAHAGVMHTELTIVIYTRMIHVSLRGKWFKPCDFAPFDRVHQ